MNNVEARQRAAAVVEKRTEGKRVSEKRAYWRALDEYLEEEAAPYHLKRPENWRKLQDRVEADDRPHTDPDGSEYGGEAGLMWPTPSPSGHIYEERLRRVLRPWVEGVREELVERTGADLPLPDLAAAAVWIEDVDESTDHALPGETKEERKRLRSEVREKLGRLAKLEKAEVGKLPIERPTLPYLRPGDKSVHRVRVAPQGPLYPLARDLEDVSEATGFEEAVLVAFVLADIPPALYPLGVGSTYRMKELPTGESVSRTEATISLRSPWVTLDKLRAAFNRIREEWGVKDRKQPSEQDRQLYSIIADLGGVPERPPRELWERVRDEAKERFGADVSADAWRVRWSNLEGRLKAHLQVEGE